MTKLRSGAFSTISDGSHLTGNSRSGRTPISEKSRRTRNVDPVEKTNFSIGHRRGATLQFPEHTKENHEAGARMGAGIQECDLTFTKDKQLVCRHDHAIYTPRPTS